MRILHTSDLHIGKKTNNISRLKEQAEVLDEIVGLCDSENVEVVIIAGDVFDTFIPSAEAERLFFDKISMLAGSDRAVLIISGNHDDETRLTAAAGLAAKHGVYIYGNLTEGDYPVLKNRKTKLVGGGKGWGIAENAEGERVYFGMLPYPDEGRFKECVNEGETFDDKMVRWVKACFENNTENLPNVLIGHFFALNGIPTKGEREIELGGTRAVKTDILPETVYTALGHLHKRQKMNSKNNVWYSGSIMQYAFDEQDIDKTVNIFDIKNGQVENLRSIPLKKGKRLASLNVVNFQQAGELAQMYKDCLVELKMHTNTPVGERELVDFKRENPNVISFILEYVGGEAGEDFRAKREMKPSELFTEYYKSKYGDDPKKELVELFMSVMGECEK